MPRYLGLDLGSVTCGVALSDALGIIAKGLTTIRFKEDDYQFALDEVMKIAKENIVKDIILGLPKHMNGDIGIRANISYDFKAKLEENGFNVTLVDERLTTVYANNLMIEGNMRREKRRELKDTLAAQIILQTYLDGRK